MFHVTYDDLWKSLTLCVIMNEVLIVTKNSVMHFYIRFQQVTITTYDDPWKSPTFCVTMNEVLIVTRHINAYFFY